jgi:hypothetical protein
MVKKGDAMYCDACGLVVVVDEECGCAETELICCGELMVPKKPATKRKKKVLSKTKVKAIAKKTRAKTKK